MLIKVTANLEIFSLIKAVICELNKLLCHHTVFKVGGHSVSVCGRRGQLGRVKRYRAGQLFTTDKPNGCFMLLELLTVELLQNLPPDVLEHLKMCLIWAFSSSADVGFNGFIYGLVSLFKPMLIGSIFLSTTHFLELHSVLSDIQIALDYIICNNEMCESVTTAKDFHWIHSVIVLM